jgi:hypothetical protein
MDCPFRGKYYDGSLQFGSFIDTAPGSEQETASCIIFFRRQLNDDADSSTCCYSLPVIDMPLVFPASSVAQDPQNNLGLFNGDIECIAANASRGRNYLFDNGTDFVRAGVKPRHAGIANLFIKDRLRSAKNGSCFPPYNRRRVSQKATLAGTENGSNKNKRNNHLARLFCFQISLVSRIKKQHRASPPGGKRRQEKLFWTGNDQVRETVAKRIFQTK